MANDPNLTYTNTNTRTDTLNQATAHDTGLYDPNVHDNQIVAMYATNEAAQNAKHQLVAAGIPAGTIEVLDQGQTSMGAGTTGGADYDSGNQGLWGAIKSLFVPDDEAHGYAEGVRRGHSVLVVHPEPGQREQVIDILERTNPIDFDAKLEEWRSAGWNNIESQRSTAGAGVLGAATGAAMSAPSATHTSPTAGTTMKSPMTTDVGASRAVSTSGTMPTAAGMGGTIPAATGARAGTDDDTIKVVEERLRVGKREVGRGSVRVRSYIVERPVEQQVRLHDERVTVERHAVNQPVGTLPADAFRERTIEVTATGEEAVVGKEARVVEEIEIRKQATERTETVRDTVRKTEVEVDEGTAHVTGGVHGTTTTGTAGTGTMNTTTPGSTVSTGGATTSGVNAPRKP